MKLGDLVIQITKDWNKAKGKDGYGIITTSRICEHRGYRIVFVRFPLTGWSSWFHPARLEVISENR